MTSGRTRAALAAAVSTLLLVPAAADAAGRIYFDRNDGGSSGFNIYSMNSDGTDVRPVIVAAGDQAGPAVSPDGRWLAYGTSPRAGIGDDNQMDLAIARADGRGQIKLTNDPSSSFVHDRNPDWSPAGDRITFVRLQGSHDIYTIRPDGSGLFRVTSGSSYDADPAFSPDGGKIAFATNQAGAGGDFDLGMVASNATTAGPYPELTSNVGRDSFPDWRADGTIAYESDRGVGTGTDIYLTNGAGTSGAGSLDKQIVNTSGNDQLPVFSPDGSELVWRNSGLQLVRGPSAVASPVSGTVITSSGTHSLADWAADSDGDAAIDGMDNCPGLANPPASGTVVQTDTDNDGIGNPCDPTPNGDTDGDGVDNLADNCVFKPNGDQSNVDGDADGDACDLVDNRPKPKTATGEEKQEKASAALSLTVKPAKKRIVRLAGRLVPSGMALSQACSGTVTISIVAGKKVTKLTTAPLKVVKGACTFAKRGKVRGKAKQVTLRASLTNAALGSPKSASRKVKLKK